MADLKKIRVAVNGYGVIGKRVAAAVALQEDMSMAGVADVVTDWRAHMVIGNGFPLFGATTEHAGAMRAAGLNVTGTLDDLLGQADVVVDCTPKRVAAKNIDVYRRRGLKFILQGGEKHEATGHSFVAESNYSSALDREATRVVQYDLHREDPDGAQACRLASACPRHSVAARNGSLGEPRERNNEHAGAGARDS
jgi:glyceraldehyde-3-phosphate dehydrogenase (NAD(P))